jgi:hypothetical protein
MCGRHGEVERMDLFSPQNKLARDRHAFNISHFLDVALSMKHDAF